MALFADLWCRIPGHPDWSGQDLEEARMARNRRSGCYAAQVAVSQAADRPNKTGIAFDTARATGERHFTLIKLGLRGNLRRIFH